MTCGMWPVPERDRHSDTAQLEADTGLVTVGVVDLQGIRGQLANDLHPCPVLAGPMTLGPCNWTMGGFVQPPGSLTFVYFLALLV